MFSAVFSLILVLLFALCNINNAQQVTPVTIFHTDILPVEGKCGSLCASIFTGGVSLYKTIGKIFLTTWQANDKAPFRNCRLYGAPDVDLTSYACTTNGTVFDHKWDAIWYNLTVTCDVDLDADPAKAISLLTQKDIPDGICGKDIPIDTVPYTAEKCSGAKDQQAGTVMMTASLGKVKLYGLLRGDRDKGEAYTLDFKDITPDEKPIQITFTGVGGELHPENMACLNKNHALVKRLLLKSFWDTVYPCILGSDRAYRIIKKLAYYMLECFGLPSIFQLG